MYKTQKGNWPYLLYAIGMLTMLFSGVLLFVSAPSLFIGKSDFSLNAVLSIFMSVTIFLFGYWLIRIFPAIKVAHNGIRCKHIFLYGAIRWSEMDTILELKNGVMALSIKRTGSPILNGLFFEWLTSKALRQKDPVVLFTPEFFGNDKTVPQEIIANAPATSGVNAYLSGKINGTGFIDPSRFSIQESENGVLITIPGKKDILEVIFLIPMTLLWSYFAGYGIYYFAIINYGAILALLQDAWDSKTYSRFLIIDAFALLFIGFILFWIWSVLASTTRHMAGKEIIEANRHILIITKQLFKRRRRSEFSSSSMTNLRVDVTRPRLLNAPYQTIQSALGCNGKIVFEFDKKTVGFGLDLTEDEGNYILSTIKSRMIV